MSVSTTQSACRSRRQTVAWPCGRSARPKAELLVAERRLEDRLEHLDQRLLAHPVHHGRDAERAPRRGPGLVDLNRRRAWPIGPAAGAGRRGALQVLRTWRWSRHRRRQRLVLLRAPTPTAAQTWPISECAFCAASRPRVDRSDVTVRNDAPIAAAAIVVAATTPSESTCRYPLKDAFGSRPPPHGRSRPPRFLRPWSPTSRRIRSDFAERLIRRPGPRATVVGRRRPLRVPPARRSPRRQAPLRATPAAARARARARARGRAAEHHPTAAGPFQSRHDFPSTSSASTPRRSSRPSARAGRR